MTHWCESCGQALPDGESPSTATWLGSAEHEHQHSFTKPSGANGGGRDKKLLLALVSIFAVWGAFVGVSSLVTPDDAIDEQAAAEIEEARLEQLEREAEEAQRLADEAEAQADAAREAEIQAAVDAALADQELNEAFAAVDAAPNAPDDGTSLGARTAIRVQVERLQRQLIRRESTALAAYRSTQGIVIIDMAGGTTQIVELTTGATTAEPGLVLLRSGAATFAIDPDTLAVAQIVDDSSLVVTESQDGNSYFVGAGSLDEHSSVVQVVADGELGAHLAPGGYTLLPLDGLGLIAVPKGPSGSTLIAGATSFEELSEHRVLAANNAGMLQQICETPISCQLGVTDFATNSQWTVPPTFSQLGDQYVLAPNGTSLLRYTAEGFSELYEADSESLSWVIGTGMQAPAWGPNSDFISWLDLVGDPKLKVMFPDERDWLTIDLRDLGAPPPLGPELIVFTQTVQPAT